LVKYPTAVHAVFDAHESPSSVLKPAGLGVRSIDQRRPFHRSANVARSRSLLVSYPTAVHAVFDVHASPSSVLTLAGLGVRSVDQRCPFHRSANVG
jgi:hypothetical protein